MDSKISSEIKPSPPTTNPPESKPVDNKPLTGKRHQADGKGYPKPKRFRDAKSGYQAKPLPSSLSTRSSKTFIQLHTATINILYFVEYVYNQIIRRDVKMQNQFTLATLQYVTLIAVYHRLASVSQKLGYSFNLLFLSGIDKIAESLHLPEPICKMIESLGAVTDGNGATYVPYIPTATQYLENPRIYPNLNRLCDLATSSTRELDSGHQPDLDLIVDFVNATTRGYKASILFRQCDFSKTEGTSEFLVAYTGKRTANLIAHTTCPQVEVIAQMGAVFQLRHLGMQSKWFGDSSMIAYTHQSFPFMPELFVSSKLVTDLSSR